MATKTICDRCGKEIPMGQPTYCARIDRNDPNAQLHYIAHVNEVCADCKHEIQAAILHPFERLKLQQEVKSALGIN